MRFSCLCDQSNHMLVPLLGAGCLGCCLGAGVAGMHVLRRERMGICRTKWEMCAGSFYLAIKASLAGGCSGYYLQLRATCDIRTRISPGKCKSLKLQNSKTKYRT